MTKTAMVPVSKLHQLTMSTASNFTNKITAKTKDILYKLVLILTLKTRDEYINKRFIKQDKVIHPWTLVAFFTYYDSYVKCDYIRPTITNFASLNNICSSMCYGKDFLRVAYF